MWPGAQATRENLRRGLKAIRVIPGKSVKEFNWKQELKQRKDIRSRKEYSCSKNKPSRWEEGEVVKKRGERLPDQGRPGNFWERV